jgi:deoxycytidine triphosphate deaminase
VSIKSDKWIRRMAQQHGMIEPFEAGQVRQANGQKIVSYGTSSYGYDVRCSDEFKIFTNVHSTVVDPKHFDEKSFVNFQGPMCIIPPNSFALARTVEHFRIPRNVLTVCLGKCVTADTRLVDAETGAYLPITEFGWGKKTLAMTDWRLRPASISEFIPQGVKPVFELRTRAGLRIKATANHPFRQLHGWTELSKLRAGDRVAIARNVPVFGKTPIPDWEASLLGLMISEGCCETPGYSPVFTNEDPILVTLLKQSFAASGMGAVTSNGGLGYRLVNHVGRGGVPMRNRAREWLQQHGAATNSAGKSVPQAIFRAPEHSVRVFLQALFSGDGGIYHQDGAAFLEYYSKSRTLVEDVHHLLLRFGIFALIREKQTGIGTTAHSLLITDVEQLGRFSEYIGFVPASIKQRRMEEEVLPAMRERVSRRRSNFDTLPAEAWGLVAAAASRAGTSMNAAGVHPSRTQSVGMTAVARMIEATQDVTLEGLASGPIWDTVESIEPAGEEEVYDISVPGAHNFVANGIVVHNSTYARCGIIVNVTPLEPEWEGYVTLEFSNTTPLPAKIYANEGVAQMLFFESDEVCETSYKDRGGKYQGQTGVTLPKI